MNYELEFKETALKEWQKLDHGLREMFKKRLVERLADPRVESARLTGLRQNPLIRLFEAPSPLWRRAASFPSP